MSGRFLSSWIIGSLAVFAFAGCASVQVESEYSGESLPRPDRILVYDFAVSPGDVELDRGISARIAEAAKGTPRSVQELEVGRNVANALSEQLVKEINALGLPAQRAGGAAPMGGNTVMIEGQFLSIDEGNRTERVVIGLGAGRSDVEAHVQVHEATAEGRRLLEALQVSAKSARAPGMAETMGAGAAAGHLAASAAVSAGVHAGSELFGANVEADAKNAAKKVAEALKPFFARQGWISEYEAE